MGSQIFSVLLEWDEGVSTFILQITAVFFLYRRILMLIFEYLQATHLGR